MNKVKGKRSFPITSFFIGKIIKRKIKQMATGIKTRYAAQLLNIEKFLNIKTTNMGSGINGVISLLASNKKQAKTT